MGLFNKFPYTDLNSINLDYTLNKLNDLYERGEALYTQLQTWQAETTEDLASWKADVEAGLAEWKTATEGSLNNKFQKLSNDINSAFSDLETQLEAHIAEIETTAVTAANNAENSAQSALRGAEAASVNNEQSKEWAIGETLEGDPVPSTNPAYENNAKYYAELLGQETEQIDQNTTDIADLKSAIESGLLQIYGDKSQWYNGYLTSTGSLTNNAKNIIPMNAPVLLEKGKHIHVNVGSFVSTFSTWRNNGDETFSRLTMVDITEDFNLVSDSDSYYYSLVFKKDPLEIIAPSDFDGSISQSTALMDDIGNVSASKLSTDGMIPAYSDLTQWQQGYFNSRGVRVSSSNRCTPLTSPIVLYAGDSIIVNPGSLSCTVNLYSYASESYTRKSGETITEKTTLQYEADEYVTFDFGKDPIAATTPDDFDGSILASVAWKSNIFKNASRIEILETASASGNYLAGKKLVACGDSITVAVNPSGGNFDSYARITAQRNGMVFDQNAVSGSTMANVTGKNPFCVDRYQQVPSDFDYLTIWFGYNDGVYSALGTIEDTTDTTFYGAYKKVLDYYLTTYPTKKIGLIVPYMSNSGFQQAVRDISVMYGVPCLDLPNYNRCSLVWGAENGAQTARKNALTYDGTHPNQTGHEFISTMYEAFLRSI